MAVHQFLALAHEVEGLSRFDSGHSGPQQQGFQSKRQNERCPSASLPLHIVCQQEKGGKSWSDDSAGGSFANPSRFRKQGLPLPRLIWLVPFWRGVRPLRQKDGGSSTRFRAPPGSSFASPGFRLRASTASLPTSGSRVSRNPSAPKLGFRVPRNPNFSLTFDATGGFQVSLNRS